MSLHVHDSNPKIGFPGSFRTYEIELFNDREKSLSQRFLVYSSGSLDKLLEFLWLKLVWDSLTREEYELFILSKKANLDYVDQFLRNLIHIPKKVLRERLLEHSFLLEKAPTRERYIGYKRINYEIHRVSRRLGRVKKFSGYVRNISSLGSKARSTFLLETSTDINNSYIEKEINVWRSIYSVGQLPLFAGEVIYP
jgi:hypothetical protein